MNLEEYRSIQRILITKVPPHISIDDLINKTDRTLIFGFDCERRSFHLYLEKCLFRICIYNSNTVIRAEIVGTSIDVHKCLPDKRIYPESCDYEFVALLILKDAHDNMICLDFDPIQATRRFNGVYMGKTIKDLEA